MAAAFRHEMRDTCEGHYVVGMSGVDTTAAAEEPFLVNDTKLSHLRRVFTLESATAEADTAPQNTDISPPPPGA